MSCAEKWRIHSIDSIALVVVAYARTLLPRPEIHCHIQVARFGQAEHQKHDTLSVWLWAHWQFAITVQWTNELSCSRTIEFLRGEWKDKLLNFMIAITLRTLALLPGTRNDCCHAMSLLAILKMNYSSQREQNEIKTANALCVCRRKKKKLHEILTMFRSTCMRSRLSYAAADSGPRASS